MRTYVTLTGTEGSPREGQNWRTAGGPVRDVSVFHLWGRVLAKFPEARALVYAQNGHIKAKLSVALQVLAELKRVLKEDAGLELNVSKTSVLPKGVSQQAAFDAACARRGVLSKANQAITLRAAGSTF